MRKTFVFALFVAGGFASGSALAFDMTTAGSSSTAPPSAATNLDAGQRFTDPTDKLLSTPLTGSTTPFAYEQRDAKSIHFGDKNGGLTFQASPSPAPAGASRYWSMETNPWR